MEAPDTIYVAAQWHPKTKVPTYHASEVKTSHPHEELYIRKDLLLEWAKELTSEPYDGTTESAHKHQIANYLKEKYNAL